MKARISKGKNYRKDLIFLIRTQYPMFLLGVFAMIIMFIISLNARIISIQFPNTRIRQKTQPAPQTNIIHTVIEDEDLWGIGEQYYGSGFNAYDIARANKLKEPYVLEKGQKLIIPSVAKRGPTQGDITSSAAASVQTVFTKDEYIVAPGEYLFQIAEKAYGDGNMMNRIIEANNIPYPYNIEAGQILKIPR